MLDDTPARRLVCIFAIESLTQFTQQFASHKRSVGHLLRLVVSSPAPRLVGSSLRPHKRAVIEIPLQLCTSALLITKVFQFALPWKGC